MRRGRPLLLLLCASTALAACVTEFDLGVPGGTSTPNPSPSPTATSVCAGLPPTAADVLPTTTLTNNKTISACSILVSTSAADCSFTLKQPFATTTLEPGSSLFLHQVQDAIATVSISTGASLDLATVGTDAGRFQVITVSAVRENANGQTVVVATGYAPTTQFSTAGGRVAQACRYPVFLAVSLPNGVKVSAEAWTDSSGGGVVAFAAQVFLLDGEIDLEGVGFPGGRIGTVPADIDVVSRTGLVQPADLGGGRGGSIDSRSATGWGRGTVGNGGGGGNSVRSGGGGGSNAGAGGKGGYEAPEGFSGDMTIYGHGAGAMVQSSSSPRLLFGGGGGAGHHNSLAVAARGGSGGGIAVLDVGTLGGTGGIYVSGNPGEAGRTVQNAFRRGAAAGGGGGGGTVHIRADDATGFVGQVRALGGPGGVVDTTTPTVQGQVPAPQGTGGGGGGGRITILTVNSAVTYVNGGPAGVLSNDFSTRGALPGDDGVIE